ncbi:MAG: integrin alpha [Phycisphaerales bacterium]|nr:integrin alpha [Phycisphaerales bacterium]
MNFEEPGWARKVAARTALVALAVAATRGMAQDFNGDFVDDLVVGAPMEDVGAISDAGAVTIIYGAGLGMGLSAFVPVPSMQITQATFGLDPPEVGDWFGATIAWGDFNGDMFDDLAIGAPGESHPVSGVQAAGMVIVLYGMPGGPIPLHPPIFVQDPPAGPFSFGDPGEAGDELGRSLAAADFNGDGFDDLAIGVPGEDDPTGVVDVGIVHVLYGSPGGLRIGPGVPLIFQSAWPWGEVMEAGDRFGQSLAAGELNGDGAADLAIGVPFEDHSGLVDAGMVNIAYGVIGPGLIPPGPVAETWTQNSPGVPTAAMANDQFGFALAIGNFDGVLGEDLAVGMPLRDFAGNVDAGSVIVIYSAGVARGLEATIAAGAPQASEWWHQNVAGIDEIVAPMDQFGWSLAAADFNGDQFCDLAIGVPGEDVGAAPIMDAGCVNVIYGAPPGLGLDAYFVPDRVFTQNTAGVPEVSEALDMLGWTLTAGDYDLNFVADLCIGVPFEDLGGGVATDRGCVMAIYGAPGIGLIGAGPVPAQVWHQNTAGIPDANEGFDMWGLGLDYDD